MTNPDIANQNRRRRASLSVFKPGFSIQDPRRFLWDRWISTGVEPVDLVIEMAAITTQTAISFFPIHNINDPTRLQVTNRFAMDSARSEGNDLYATKHIPLLGSPPTSSCNVSAILKSHKNADLPAGRSVSRFELAGVERLDHRNGWSDQYGFALKTKFTVWIPVSVIVTSCDWSP